MEAFLVLSMALGVIAIPYFACLGVIKGVRWLRRHS